MPTCGAQKLQIKIDGLQDIQSDGRVWFGDQALEPTTCGLVLLGTLFGSPEFIASHLQSLSADTGNSYT